MHHRLRGKIIKCKLLAFKCKHGVGWGEGADTETAVSQGRLSLKDAGFERQRVDKKALWVENIAWTSRGGVKWDMLTI